MTTEELIAKVRSLSAEEQSSIAQFIDFLEKRHVSGGSPFLEAASDFMAEHPELLRRLSH